MSDEFKQIVEFDPAFDRRSPNPRENYGIHGVELRMVLKSPDGAVQFVLYTNWMLPHVRKEMHERMLRGPDLIGLQCAYDPMPADLGYHSPKPMFEGHEPIGACPYIDGPCYYDGSGLNANRIFDVLVAEGSDRVWRELRKYYDETFRRPQVTNDESPIT